MMLCGKTSKNNQPKNAKHNLRSKASCMAFTVKFSSRQYPDLIFPIHYDDVVITVHRYANWAVKLAI